MNNIHSRLFVIQNDQPGIFEEFVFTLKEKHKYEKQRNIEWAVRNVYYRSLMTDNWFSLNNVLKDAFRKSELIRQWWIRLKTLLNKVIETLSIISRTSCLLLKIHIQYSLIALHCHLNWEIFLKRFRSLPRGQVILTA